MATTFTGTAAGVLESLLRIAAGDSQAGSKTKENADEKVMKRVQSERGAIDANAVEERKSEGALCAR